MHKRQFAENLVNLGKAAESCSLGGKRKDG